MSKAVCVRIAQYEQDRKEDREYIDSRFDSFHQKLGKVEANMESVMNGTQKQGERLGNAESKIEVLSKELERYSKGVEEKFDEIKKHSEERAKVYREDRKQDRELLETKLEKVVERLNGVSDNLSGLKETVREDMEDRKDKANDMRKLKNRFWGALIDKLAPLLVGVLVTILGVLFSHPEILTEVIDKLK